MYDIEFKGNSRILNGECFQPDPFHLPWVVAVESKKAIGVCGHDEKNLPDGGATNFASADVASQSGEVLTGPLSDSSHAKIGRDIRRRAFPSCDRAFEIA